MTDSADRCLELMADMMRTMHQFHGETISLMRSDVAELKAIVSDVAEIKTTVQQLTTDRDTSRAIDAYNRRLFRRGIATITAIFTTIWWFTTEGGWEWMNKHLK
jgi:hypothetical protein